MTVYTKREAASTFWPPKIERVYQLLPAGPATELAPKLPHLSDWGPLLVGALCGSTAADTARESSAGADHVGSGGIRTFAHKCVCVGPTDSRTTADIGGVYSAQITGSGRSRAGSSRRWDVYRSDSGAVAAHNSGGHLSRQCVDPSHPNPVAGSL